jgi:hypothetical protein
MSFKAGSELPSISFKSGSELPSIKLLPSVSLGINRTYPPSSTSRLSVLFPVKTAPASLPRYKQTHKTMDITGAVTTKVAETQQTYGLEDEIVKRQCLVVGCVRYAKIRGKCLLHTAF